GKLIGQRAEKRAKFWCGTRAEPIFKFMNLLALCDAIDVPSISIGGILKTHNVWVNLSQVYAGPITQSL
ncbi:MAG: hypothetical protein ABR60_04700, partial [Actinobacteria bacterium BACL2 MAG-120802-bin41]